FFGVSIKGNTLDIILPVGISFYTFQTLSYTIDVYRRKLEPARDFLTYAAYVCFFPQLVAGPIERGTHLLPQFRKLHQFDYARAVDGLRQILWGLVKKIVIADNCAHFADKVFNNPDNHNGASLALGVLAFTFQIYGDFSGYSDIAIGTSRLFGFDLKQNFAFPYFSRDIAEFWRRWHISLSTWFRDYLYIPLGGSRGSRAEQIRNVFIIFLVSGFWHGANWTFVVWGLLHAIYFLPLLLLGRNRNHLEVVAAHRWYPSFREVWQMLTTFLLVSVAWIFFRVETVGEAFVMLRGIGSPSLFGGSSLIPERLGVAVLLFVVVEWFGRRDAHALERLFLSWPRVLRWLIYLLLATLVLVYQGPKQGFIYFQF
ncbi:MAG: MBOAT family O-acyltransferase, partial [Bacteroidota bacterium]